jgi:hypothetical protein
MKNVLTSFLAVVALGLSAHASQPGVITVVGSLTKANESQCPLRTFQYYVTGDFRTSKGAIANFGACLENVSIPLFESLNNSIAPSDSNASRALDRATDAENILVQNTGRLLKMRFIVDDPEQLKGGLGTLLSIEEAKK